MRVVYWGTYDKGKPRNRILINGLRSNGVEVVECNTNLWAGIEDKTQLSSKWQKILIVFKWILSYPSLIYRFLITTRIDCVVVGYLGHFDVLILWLFAKLKRVPVVWDAFISLYDTIIEDRKICSPDSLVAKIIYFIELLACKASNLVVLDTNAHANYFIEKYGMDEQKCVAVFVGVEPEKFPIISDSSKKQDNKHFRILFYGQFIPLHGIPYIVEAAELLKSYRDIYWTIIGDGQEASKVKTLLSSKALPQLTWIRWVDYDDLKEHIYKADVCLGIFGTTEKASRVIPNKVFQIISCGKAVITRDSLAIRELIPEMEPGIYIVNAGDPQQITDKIKYIYGLKEDDINKPYFVDIRKKITPEAVGKDFFRLIKGLIGHL